MNKYDVILYAKSMFKIDMKPDDFSVTGASVDFFKEGFVDGLPEYLQDVAIYTIPQYFNMLAEKLDLYSFITSCIGMPLDVRTKMYVENQIFSRINYHESIIGKSVAQECIEAVYYLYAERNGLSDANEHKESLLKVRFGADSSCGRGIVDAETGSSC